MLVKQSLPLNKTQLTNLVYDYVLNNEKTTAFFNYYPDINGFKKLFSSPDLFKQLSRKTLVSELKLQALSVNNTTEHSLKNIDLLNTETTFTVTTGHQLCLFTGPLYFIYKIFSVINLCETLKKQFPDKNFVPVYWMASEDHDFEEINHFSVFGKKITWATNQSGAVGGFETKGLNELFQSIKTIFGNTPQAEELVLLFEKAYLKHNNLSDATRYLVNELFGQYGLVVADGHSAQLKNLFKDYFKKDIFEQVPYKKVSETIAALTKSGYEPQVNPREINIFYIEQGIRSRIEKEGDSYTVLGTDKVFSKQQMNNLIEDVPEKISPNVVLRPCYQQVILPNIAYVGGPGELAYWLEYKTMFNTLNITYPLLVLRKMLTVVELNQVQKLEKLGFVPEDIFKAEQDLIKNYLKDENSGFNSDMYSKKIEDMFSEIRDELIKADKTLAGFVEAEKQKALNSLLAIEAKLKKSLKQKSENEINQIKNLKNKFYPGGLPQERVENFATYYLRWGKEFLVFLKQNLEYDLLTVEQVLVREQN